MERHREEEHSTVAWSSKVAVTDVITRTTCSVLTLKWNLGAELFIQSRNLLSIQA